MKLFLLLAILCKLGNGDIYDYLLHEADGTTLDLSEYRGKKMLIVNIATDSPRDEQLQLLQTLQSTFPDSLIVIACISNSFGTEIRSDSLALEFCRQNYNVTFPVIAQAPVSGNSIQPLYQWLTTSSLNGVAQIEVQSDYQKFLIDADGHWQAVFAGSVLPNDQVILDAIRQN